MRLGIWTPLPHTVRVEPEMAVAIDELSHRGKGGKTDRSLQLALDVVKRAEALGFATTLIAERHIGPDLEAWMMGAAMIAETETIELLVAVHPGIVHPQLAAKMGASLDRISGGRFAINVVNGWFQKEFEVFGNGTWLDRTEARYARMGEFMQVLKGLWCEDRFDFDGEYFRLEDAELPIKTLQVPNPPIYAASSAAQGMDQVARHADVWFVGYEPGFDNAAQNIERIARDVEDMRKRADRYGRKLRFGISAHVICTENRAEAVARARSLEEYGARDRISLVAAKALGAGLVGTPDEIVERLTALDQIGVEIPMIHFFPMMDGLETFAAEIMPRLPADR
jgi:FMNH2-dependent dimethyl sulfone monooxygenase